MQSYGRYIAPAGARTPRVPVDNDAIFILPRSDARDININGTDKAELIAGYAEKFLKCLK